MKTYYLLSSIVASYSLLASALITSGQDANTASAPSIKAPPALVQANNQFALDLFHQISGPSSKNTFFSPYSISTALAMTWAGARGNTAAEIAKTFHFSDVADGKITADFKLLQQLLAATQSNSGIQLSVANSLWPEQNPEAPFLPEYLKLVQSDFASEITPMDFKNHADDAASKINQWVEDKTKNKIKNLIHPRDVNPDTRLVLVNAIYFKGDWASPFEQRFTKSAPFYMADGTSKRVPMMRQFVKEFSESRYADITDAPVPCQILELPYSAPQPDQLRDHASAPMLSMVIVLPRDRANFDQLEQSLTTANLTGWLGQLQPGRVEVYLPKFHVEHRFQLAGALASMGVKDAFVYGPADFSGMDGTRNLYITKVIHQAFVDVDEEGTEAAAATAVVMAVGGAAPPPPPIFRADHPFLFFIRERTTGSILFMGRMADPTDTSLSE
jgi:serpin B